MDPKDKNGIKDPQSVSSILLYIRDKGYNTLLRSINNKYTAWTLPQAVAEAYNFLDWLKRDNTNENVFYYDYFTTRPHIRTDWLLHLVERFEDNADFVNLLKRARLMQYVKKLGLAQKGEIKEITTIFEGKARHGYRDGSENKGTTINMLTANMNAQELDTKVTKLIALRKSDQPVEAIEAEFQDIPSPSPA